MTLLTDFGVSDPYVGVMKGVILSAAPSSQVVDVTHAVPQQDVLTGSVFLRATVSYFPPGSVHVAVIDPGVGGPRRALAAQTERNLYVAPDNGVLSGVLADEKVLHCVDITPLGERQRPGATFHGRDVFAPVAGLLASGAPLVELGPTAGDLVTVASRPAQRPDGSTRGRILFADSFGNLVSNVRRDDVLPDIGDIALGDDAALSVGAPVSHYGAVPVGAPLAVWNSYDLLELALRNGDMAARVGWRPGQTLTVTIQR